MRYLLNWFLWGQWNNCQHLHCEPVGFADHRCVDCGAET